MKHAELPVAPSALAASIDAAAPDLEDAVLAWRRDLHQHPELGNREFRTSAIVAAHLKKLEFDEVREGVAHTVLDGADGARPGTPVVEGEQGDRRQDEQQQREA